MPSGSTSACGAGTSRSRPGCRSITSPRPARGLAVENLALSRPLGRRAPRVRSSHACGYTPAMRLELRWSLVTSVEAGDVTDFDRGALRIDLAALRALLEGDQRLGSVRVDLAHAGESCRIGRVFDVFAPRAREDGGPDFPGVVGALGRAGSGRTRGLGNVAVVVTDQQLDNPAGLAVIDMSGPAAQLSAFGRTHNLVISAQPAPSAGRAEYLAAIRLAGLRAANAAQRATVMLLDKLAARPVTSEVPLPSFPRVPAPAAVRDLGHAVVALVTDGGIVPAGNPDGIEALAATRFGAYSIEGRGGLGPGQYDNVHRGYDTRFVKAEPHRLVPVDVARDLEREGAIGKLHETVYSTTGVATTLAHSERMGREMAAKLRAARVDAVILTST